MSLKGREIMRQRRESEAAERRRQRRETQREIRPRKAVALGRRNVSLAAALLAILEHGPKEDT